MPDSVRPSAVSGVGCLGVLVASAVACATTTSLEIKKVAVAVEPPANVAMHLKVTRPDGQAVTLLATDFKVYEDGKAIPAKKLKRALLPASVAVDRFVMVVIDLSGPLVDSEYLSTLQDAVATFTERVGKDAHFALSVFDGDGLKPLVGFEDADRKAGLAAMRKFRPHNRTIDLWGMFIASLDALDEAAKAKSSVPERASTLVFMTDRRDKAGRHSLDDANTRLQASPATVYVLGVGDGVNREELQRLGKPDAFFVEKLRDLGKPFDDTADRIETTRGQDYVFAYCSTVKPGKRPSTHKVEIKIETKQWSGDIEHELSSKGFVKGACDPHKKPDFASKEGQSPGDEGGASDDAGASDEKAEGKKAGGKKKKVKPVEEEVSAGGAEES
jgi:hypothetical protein